METIFLTTNNPKHFAIAVNYKLRINPNENIEYLNTLKFKFKNPDTQPILKILSKYLEISPAEYLKKRPALTELFSNNYGEDTYIIFIS